MALIPFKKTRPHKTREGKIGLTLKAQGIETIIDIGANNGAAYENFRKGGFTGNIISIEPLPALQEGLQSKAAQDPYWKILPSMAIGECNGETEIHVSEASDLSSALEPSQSLLQALPKSRVMDTITVPMKTLNTLYEELDIKNKNTFIKIDTQGYEMNILNHGEKALEQIKGLQIEMSLFELYEGETLFDEIIAFLKARGFALHMLIETNFSKALNRQLQVDGVFYKEEK